MDIEKHLNAWIDGDNYYLYKYLKEVVKSAIAQDSAERGDIVERLERLKRKSKNGVVLYSTDDGDWALIPDCSYLHAKGEEIYRDTIPAVLEAAEKEVE